MLKFGAAFALYVGSCCAATAVYTDLASWSAAAAAAGGTIIINGNQANIPGLTVGTYDTYHGFYLLAGSDSYHNGVYGGGFNGSKYYITEWASVAPLYAWGGTFSMSSVWSGLWLGTEFPAESFVGQPWSGFVGIVSDTPFTTVDMFPAGYGFRNYVQSYTLSNLVVAEAPEPAPAALLAVAGVALFASMHRRLKQ